MNRRPPKPLTIKELERIKALIASGMTYHAVAVQIGRDPKTVKNACLKPQTAQEIQVIKQELADMYEELARRMLNSITDADITKISAYQRTLSSGIATDKMRLLRNESTENIGISALLQEIRSEKDALLKELAEIGDE
jgi:IS30 family transposase